MKSKLTFCLAAAALLGLLTACGGGGPVTPSAAPKKNPVAGLSFAAAKDAHLVVRVTVPRRAAGLRTQSVPATFNYAVAQLTGPLLNADRALTIPFASVAPGQTVVSTIAGTGLLGVADGARGVGQFTGPAGLARADDGTLYIADRDYPRIRVIDGNGKVTTLAGSGTPTYSDGTGSQASFNVPGNMIFDGNGDLIVADSGNHAIRRVTVNGGVVTTIAGNGQPGSVDGTGTGAQFNGPVGLARDAQDNIYVAEYIGNRIRKIDSQGVVSTLAGSGVVGHLDAVGTAARLNGPQGIALDPNGNLYIAEAGGNYIRKLAPDGTVTTIAGNGSAGSADGQGANVSFDDVSRLVFDHGVLYSSEINNNRIRQVDPDGTVTTVFANAALGFTDGTGAAGTVRGLLSFAFDPDGNIYVADYINHAVRKLTFQPTVASGVFTNLRPGDGYNLAVSLYDNGLPANHVLASGQAQGPFSLAAGSNGINVRLSQSVSLVQGGPEQLLFSALFGNSVLNAVGQPAGVVIVAGDVVALNPGLDDPNSQVGRVELRLDGTSSQNYQDGDLLSTWYGDDLTSIFFWDTSTTLDPPGNFGNPPLQSQTPPHPAGNIQGMHILSGVAPPSSVAAEGTPNHKLTFTIFDRYAPSGNNLIRTQSYDLTVVNPASLDIGIQ